MLSVVCRVATAGAFVELSCAVSHSYQAIVPLKHSCILRIVLHVCQVSKEQPYP